MSIDLKIRLGFFLFAAVASALAVLAVPHSLLATFLEDVGGLSH